MHSARHMILCQRLSASNREKVHYSLVFMYDGVEELAVPPAGGEVVAADALVAVRHPLGPQQQLLLGRHVF